jgi:hypothetical protein
LIKSLHTTLHQAHNILEQYSVDKSANELDENHRRYLQYITKARSLKGEKLSLESTSDLSPTTSNNKTNNQISAEYEFAANHFPVPIVVVIWQTNPEAVSLTSPGDYLTLKASKELQGKLRLLCLEVQGTLMNNNIPMEQSTHLLRRYLIHRLYPEWIAFENGLKVDDKLDNCFIPSGFDTKDLIAVTTPNIINSTNQQSVQESLLRYLENQQLLKQQTQQQQPTVVTTEGANQQSTSTTTSSSSTALAASTSSTSAEISIATVAAAENIVFQEIESEQEWLSGLFKFIGQGKINQRINQFNFSLMFYMCFLSSN